ncbi:hypothetical protein [Sphingomonas sp. CV7422]|uniref:hypothetical protein n=1 Tax=Sphingomonas sp. CV7422 TaxID=3018036 RepID=UPI0022FF11A0|nr:hypothetical protein [Sphingomonas sp. CV7422]
MKVRVFRPANDADFDYLGEDFDFEAVPAVGQMLRYTNHEPADLLVERAGFIQDGESFVACVWLKDEPRAYDMKAFL